MIKGLYRVFNGGEVNGGVVFDVGAGPPIMAVDSFADFYEIGEGFYMKASTLKEGYPLQTLRPWMRGKAYGVIVYNSIKGAPLKEQNRIGALLALGARPRLMARPTVFTGRYEARRYRMPTPQLWDAWSWIDWPTAEFHPAWSNGNELSVRSKGECRVSFHLQRGRRALLVAANYEREPQTVRVTLDAGKLGLEGQDLQCLDAITRKAIPMEGSAVSLECEPELYRYVMVGTRDEIEGPSMDPDHPRVPFGTE